MRRALHEIYDGFADDYELNRGVFDLSEILSAFYARLGSCHTDQYGANLLDLGCGAGEPVARFFIERDWTVTGVDFSTRMLELASGYVPEMHAINADLRDVEFDSEGFDAITATYSLFHLPCEQHQAVFENCYRWLKPNGHFLFTYATEKYTGHKEFSGYKTFMGNALFYSHTTPQKVIAELQQSGFSIEDAAYHDIGGESFYWITVKKPPTG